jgi:hypothetical protein
MRPRRSGDAVARGEARRLATRSVLCILWPAFLMAGVLEMLVFVVVDPATLNWFGGPLLEWPVKAVYSVTFLIFWAVIAAAGALTALLDGRFADRLR